MPASSTVFEQQLVVALVERIGVQVGDASSELGGILEHCAEVLDRLDAAAVENVGRHVPHV
jgi:hypothetical protein